MEFYTSEAMFVATCTEAADGTWKAVLKGRSPAGFRPKPPGQPTTEAKLLPEEHFAGKRWPKSWRRAGSGFANSARY